MVEEVRRRVVTTTVSPDTEQFFKDNPNLVLGRSIDLWVKEQREKAGEERENRFAARIAALQTGACRCGRIIYPSRKLQREVCPGCMGEPASCGCQPTLALREKYFLEWQADREKGGIGASGAEMDAKRKELGLDDKDWRKKQFERTIVAGREHRFEEEAARTARTAADRAAIEAFLVLPEAAKVALIAEAKAKDGGSLYDHPMVAKVRKPRR